MGGRVDTIVGVPVDGLDDVGGGELTGAFRRGWQVGVARVMAHGSWMSNAAGGRQGSRSEEEEQRGLERMSRGFGNSCESRCSTSTGRGMWSGVKVKRASFLV